MSAIKKLLLYGLGTGAGLVITGGLVIGGWVWYAHQPRPWDARAVTARFDLAIKDTEGPWLKYRATPPAPPEGQDDTGFDLWYLVTNNTHRDYELSPQTTVHAILKDSHAMTFGTSTSDEPSIQFPVTSDVQQSIFIPAGKTARVTVHLPGYSTVKDTATLVTAKGESYAQASPRVIGYLKKRAPNLGGFVMLDRNHKYEIDLPLP